MTDDSPLTGILDLLTLDATADGFVGRTDWRPQATVYGGLILGQAAAAALGTVEGRTMHAMQGVFLRGAKFGTPVRYIVEALQDGSSFSRRGVRALQGETPVFVGTVSLQANKPGLAHAAPMPADVPGPDDVPPEPASEHITSVGAALDVRPVPGAAFHDSETGAVAFWLRATEALPDDPAVHQAYIAYLSDFAFFGSALRRHGVDHRAVRATSLDHALWVHSLARADQWLLFVQESPQSRNSRALVSGRIYTREGELIATVAQEGMLSLVDA